MKRLASAPARLTHGTLIMVDLHRLAEIRSIAYHHAVGEKILRDPAVLERARKRVRGWIEVGEHPFYANAWGKLLDLPVRELLLALVDPAEAGCALRQVTPFAGALAPKERWAIWREHERLRTEASR